MEPETHQPGITDLAHPSAAARAMVIARRAVSPGKASLLGTVKQAAARAELPYQRFVRQALEAALPRWSD